jgi:CheY-like chemotaxis protein
VWDTGIGIDQTDMPHLFEPFVQADSSLARQHEGTGLGLSLVYRLTEMHGGSVAVESKVGEGSRFTVSLPWVPENEKHALYAGHRSGSSKSEPHPDTTMPSALPKILLADDNDANITTLSGYLEARGYQVVVARNGTEALSRAKEDEPELILMDIQMPTMDGLEATRRIRADAELKAIPIIALTALAMPHDRERCLDAGANEYLSKPVSLKKLVEMIEALLSMPQETIDS